MAPKRKTSLLIIIIAVVKIVGVFGNTHCS